MFWFQDQQFLVVKIITKQYKGFGEMYNLLSFIVLLICFNQSLSQSQSQSSDVFVKFMTPQKELVTNELTLPATIKPNEKVNITSTVSEKIEKIFFKEGVSVKKRDFGGFKSFRGNGNSKTI